MSIERRKRAGWWLVAGWGAVVLGFTLPPSPHQITTSDLCLLCGERGLADAVLNVALFLPLGVGGRLVGLSLRRIFAAALLASCAIEAIQVVTPGRDASLGDVVFNAAGALAGGATTPWLGTVLRPGARTARLLGALWTGAVALGIFGLAALLEPRVAVRPLTVESRPIAPQGGRYEGAILSIQLNGEPVVEGATIPVEGPGGPSDTVAVRFTVAAGRVAFRPLLGLRREGEQPSWLLGPSGADLVLRLDRPVDGLRLSPADFRIEAALATARIGDTLLARTWRSDSSYCLELSGHPQCGYAFTTGSGWALLMPTGWASAGRSRWLDAAWLALLAAPLGYWGRRGAAAWVGLALLLGAATLAPAVSELVAAPLATLGGLAAGWAGGRLARRAVEARAGVGGSASSRPTE